MRKKIMLKKITGFGLIISLLSMCIFDTGSIRARASDSSEYTDYKECTLTMWSDNGSMSTAFLGEKEDKYTAYVKTKGYTPDSDTSIYGYIFDTWSIGATTGCNTRLRYTVNSGKTLYDGYTYTDAYMTVKLPIPKNCKESTITLITPLSTSGVSECTPTLTESSLTDGDGYFIVEQQIGEKRTNDTVGYLTGFGVLIDVHLHYTLSDYKYDSTNHYLYCDTEGEIFAKEAHEFDESGQCYCGYTKGADGSSTGTPASEGTSLTDKSGNSTGFEVTNSDSANATVAYEGTTADSSKTSITILDTVTDASGNVYKVTEIKAGALKNNKKLKSVTIGSNVETIGSSAFEGCENLKTIKMGSSVEKIGSKAFKNCKKLTKVTLPSTVTEIGSNAFSGDSKLSSITISTKSLKKVGKNALKGIKSTATIKLKGTKKQKAAAKKKITKSKTGYKSSMKIK